MENKEKEILQKLREVTGAGVMETRRAFVEASGDFDEAVKKLREKGLEKVEKRAGRSAGAGVIHSYVHNGRIGVLVDLRAETDFVVRSDPFRALVHDLAMHIAASAPKDLEELFSQPYIKDESKTIKDIVNEVIAKVGENVVLNQFSRIEL